MSLRNQKSHQMDLYEAVAQLEDAKEGFHFFRDMCSEKELQSMEQRFAVARMLLEGCTYTDIAARTNASTATISRVGRMLSDGTGAVETVLRRLEITPSADSV